MIIEWIAQALGWLWGVMCGIFPTFAVPSWFASVASATSTVNGYMTGLGNWFPFPILINVLTVLLTIYVVSFSVKIIRIVASFFTAGGGSAA